MNVLHTSDLHGCRQFYREIVDCIEGKEIDAIFLGGDLLPRMGHDDTSVKIQRDFIRDEIYPFLLEVKERSHASVFAIPGNNDWAAVLPDFRKLEEAGFVGIPYPETRCLTEGIRVLGYPYVPPTPFSPKDFERRDQTQDAPRQTTRNPVISLNGRIEAIDEIRYFNRHTAMEDDLASLPLHESGDEVIFLFHAPPYDTRLDRPYNETPLGSRAVRHFIQKNQPRITLHGHIHESPAVTSAYGQKIGKTVAVNAGQSERRLSAVIFDPDRPEETMTHTIYGDLKITGAEWS
jgi:Icc-related predicted phosphoesterase